MERNPYNSVNPENSSGMPENNNSVNPSHRNYSFTEFHPRNNNNIHHTSLESSFSRLSVNGDHHHLQQTPSFRTSSNNGDSLLMGRLRAQHSADYCQALIRAHQNGAHQNLNLVGPTHNNILPRMLNLQPWPQQQQLLYSEDDDYLRCNYDVSNSGFPHLQTTSPLLPREPTAQFQILPCLKDYNHFEHLVSSNFVPRNLNFRGPNAKVNQELASWNEQIDLMGSNSDLRGKVVNAAKDQHGSKMLQANLEKGNNEEIEIVLSEVVEYVGDLMKNQSGSYVIQKLFVVCNEEQRTTIIQAITRNSHQFIGICFSQHGARAMQKLLDNLSTPQQRSLILSAITPVAVALANDQSGQHVIQYCVKTFSIEYTRHLLKEIANNCFAIATQKSGCCVLQSCVESARGELRDRLITEILTNAVQLSEDQYGNYVVQHLVGLKLPRVTETLLDRLQGNFVTLSCNKYASNVVEKIILESGEEHSTRIISELLRSSSASTLLVDPYGNFVIQTALQIAKGHVFNALCNLITLNSPSMQSNLYGKKILDRLFSKKDPLHCTRFYKRQV
ncbi:pumilio homolog 15-like [Lycium barbarum]|uniref:pumilio homolog 15-like n=1 Tax=Lycium barbarum TaxID=112863 RepID=UPI00293F70DC|nr:pumilio homolog 15-like [Lycium barbarum]